MFSEHTLTDIRTKVDLVELIEGYVELKKSGQGYVGLCPFHGEKTGSFHVQPLKQVFKCFGCGKGGNVFSFLKLIEGLSFPEAVRRLAEKAGVDISEEWKEKKDFVPKNPLLEECYRALHWASRYYHFLLTENEEYKYARNYLTQRGLTEKTIKKFEIGVSPHGWNTTRDLLLKRGFSARGLEKAGLLVDPSNAKGGYDRFRERLMFPIRDVQDRVIGFGARLLKDDPKQPKYLNSSDSEVFSKRKHLYGLCENQRGIRLQSEAVLVEGYMDVVGLYEKGVTNAVATMGTALTEDHCLSLKAYCKKLVTVFDPDDAGMEASRRSIPLFLKAGIFAKDLSLPEGLDPDEFVLKYGKEAFVQKCEKAPRQVDKLLKSWAKKGALSAQAQAQALEDFVPILQATRKLPDRAMLWDSISLVLKVSIKTLESLSQPQNQATPGVPVREQRAFSRYEPGRGGHQTPPPQASRFKASPLEKSFFQACLENPKTFLALDHSQWERTMESEELKKWLLIFKEARNVEEFYTHIEQFLEKQPNSPWQSIGSGILIGGLEEEKENTSYFKALLSRLESKRLESEIHALSAQVKLTQPLGDEEEQMRLLQRLSELRAQKSRKKEA